jgi:hypothetical protein
MARLEPASRLRMEEFESCPEHAFLHLSATPLVSKNFLRLMDEEGLVRWSFARFTFSSLFGVSIAKKLSASGASSRVPRHGLRQPQHIYFPWWRCSPNRQPQYIFRGGVSPPNPYSCPLFC